MAYFVTFRTTDQMDPITYDNVSSLNTDDPMELEEVVLHCETLECEAELYSEQGFHRGSVKADGSYILR